MKRTVRRSGFTKLLVGFLAVCIVLSGVPMAAMAAPSAAESDWASFTQDDLERVYDSFMDTYYKDFDNGNFRLFPGENGATHFWEAAYLRQMFVEYFNLTGKNKDLISETFYKFEEHYKIDRFGNKDSWIINDSDWNDDYSWASQFAISAYAVTKDQHMLDQAKWHFDYFYSHTIDDIWGGGMWRERTVNDQKDIPTNGFAIVAAQLAQYYPEEKVMNLSTSEENTYLEIAQSIYDWIKVTFMRPDGGIMNSLSTGSRGWDDNLYTYNAGIFIELAAHLYDLTKDQKYIDDAVKAADFAIEHFTTGENKLLVYEDGVNDNGFYKPNIRDSYEIVFKGILIRGIDKLITMGNQDQYKVWIANNAQAAYDNRNNIDLTSPQFDTKYNGNNARVTGVAVGMTAMLYSLEHGYELTPPAMLKLKGKIEGEAGKLYGDAKVTADARASGSARVSDITSVGSALEFANVEAASKLRIGYASIDPKPQLSLYVNGEFSTKVNLPKTPLDWGNGAYLEGVVTADIPEGATIKLQHDEDDTYLNVDYIKLIPATTDKQALSDKIAEAEGKTEGEYTGGAWKLLQAALTAAKEINDEPDLLQSDVDEALAKLISALAAVPVSGKIEAESGILYPSAYAQSDSAASGGLMVGSIDHLGAAVEFLNIAATEKMIISNASGKDKPQLSLYIDGVFSQKLELVKTGGWGGKFVEKIFDVNIPKGSTVKIQYDDGDEPANLDYIVFLQDESAVVDKSELNNRINVAMSMAQRTASDEAWSEFEKAYAAAVVVSNNDGADKHQVEAALARLNEAITGLKPVPNELQHGKIEAETGTLYGTASLYLDGYASGGYHVRNLSKVGNAVEITNVAASSQIIIGYSIADYDAQLSLYVNDVDTMDVTLVKTPGNAGRGAYSQATVKVDIPDGAKIKLQYDAGDKAANIDYIAITDTDSSALAGKVLEVQTFLKDKGQQQYTADTWATLQAALKEAERIMNALPEQNIVDAAMTQLEAAKDALKPNIGQLGKIEGELGAMYNTAYAQLAQNASGGYMVGSLDHVGSAVEFRNLGEANRLTVSYTSGNGSPKLSLYINGEDKGDLAFTHTGGWSGPFAEKTFDIVIPDGATLRLQYDQGDSAANIDYIILSSKESVDTTELVAAITTAQAKVDSAKIGDEPGQYPQAAADAFKAAIAEANSVVTTATTQDEVTAAIGALQAAVQVFDAAQVQPEGDTLAPKWPMEKTLTPSLIRTTSISLSWLPAEDDTAVTSYKLYMNGTEIASVTGSVYQYSVTGLTSDTLYTFKVEAGDQAGNWSTDGPTVSVRTSSNSTSTPIPTPETKPEQKPDPKPETPSQTDGETTEPSVPELPKVILNDIENHWAQTAIERSIELGIVKGYEDGTFRANKSVNRAEFATMLARALKLNTENVSVQFNDQDSIPAWAQGSISALAQLGYINGYQDNSFRATQEITRTELAVIIVRVFGLVLDPQATLAFKDAAQVPAWAKAYVAAAYDAGLIQGRGDGKYYPSKASTRAEAVTLILAMLDHE